MSFIVDKQTLDDLNLLGKYKPGSVFGLFNKVRTRGGERFLEEMFRQPLTDPADINRRTAIFQYMEGKAMTFPFNREQFERIEDYLGASATGNLLTTAADILRKRLLEAALRDTAYGNLREDVLNTIGFLHSCRGFFDRFDEEDTGNPLQQEIRSVKRIFRDRRLAALPGQQRTAPLSWKETARLHHLFVQVLQEEMSRLLEVLYTLDLYIAVSAIAAEKQYSYARALPAGEEMIFAEDLRHPCLVNAVGNPICLDTTRNVLFLTGANMAGKSTLMKSLGIALYLAHMGFPVAAAKMEFSVRDGLYSSINVPDDLSLGYSHFYAEVQRVKTIALEVSQSKSLLVIFDELFKGTNVKDAYDATLAVTMAFAEYRNCCFVISTHIIEVGEALKAQHDNFQFAYLPTMMEGPSPRYTYRLTEGITNDRHGMMIIEQEGILDIIRHQKFKK